MHYIINEGVFHDHEGTSVKAYSSDTLTSVADSNLPATILLQLEIVLSVYAKLDDNSG